MSHVFIGIPQHGGQINSGVMRSLHDCLFGSQHLISYQCMGLSLLARNFNSLWIQAYKRGADYFILHHADLAVSSPYPGVAWCDLLIDRMRSLNAAVMSVASPIKSKFGHFSMGLDMKAGNPYTLRRTTARELFLLPNLFVGRADLCDMYDVHPDAAGAFIVNTGCFIMDLKRFPWRQLQWPGFNIVDNIQWSLNGVPLAYTEPEDWNASRWLHRHEIPFFATKEVHLEHFGGKTYENQGLWGDLHDDTPMQPSMEVWKTLMVPMGAAA
jgi:hypothetical protein